MALYQALTFSCDGLKLNLANTSEAFIGRLPK